MVGSLSNRKKQRGEKPSTAKGQFSERPKYTQGSRPTQSCIYSIYSQALKRKPGQVGEGNYIAGWGHGGLLSGASLVGLCGPQGCSAWALWETCLPV